MTTNPATNPPSVERTRAVLEANAADLLHYFQRRVHDREDAADLLGSVLLVVWEKHTRVPEDPEQARMWCFGVARNVMRRYYRHQTKQIGLADRLRDHLRATAVLDNAASTAAEARIRDHEVRDALMSLDRKTRELVMLVHWDGFLIAQAARILEVNESTARTRHQRALRRLEQILAVESPNRLRQHGLDADPIGS
ncbi:RNA polymerase sigma factor [Microbacterium sp. Clip185]|uniref:RNA polymerase sigma factor n=1 Tax=Microbacterium sp. Clip185 TaxID=3025663 RepID=UPI0030824AE0